MEYLLEYFGIFICEIWNGNADLCDFFEIVGGGLTNNNNNT